MARTFGRALALALCVTASTAFGAEAPEAQCSVTISYLSNGGLIDTPLAQTIDRSFRHDPRIVKRERRMSHHGGYDVCLMVQPPNKARTIFRAIRSLMPAYSTRAPTTLRYAGGRYRTKFRSP